MNEQRKRGQLDALQGKPRYYGCHLGMRSSLEQYQDEYYQGYDEITALFLVSECGTNPV